MQAWHIRQHPSWRSSFDRYPRITESTINSLHSRHIRGENASFCKSNIASGLHIRPPQAPQCAEPLNISLLLITYAELQYRHQVGRYKYLVFQSRIAAYLQQLYLPGPSVRSSKMSHDLQWQTVIPSHPIASTRPTQWYKRQPLYPGY